METAIAKAVPAEHYIRTLLELSDAFLIFPCPEYISPDEPYMTGRYCTRLDKETLEVTTYDILSNLEALKNAKKIK